MSAGGRRLAVGLEYDGARFAGWQLQPGLSTIQGEVQRALALVADHPVEATCAGRTDAAVHALCQVAHFDTRSDRPLRGWVLGANTNLPPEISVLWAVAVDPQFHARHSALTRCYRYCILQRATRPALLRERAWWLRAALDAAAMQEAAQSLIGEHDFSAFRAAECQSQTTRRRVDSIRVAADGPLVTIEVTANAFLHHMVRNIVGTLVQVGTGEQTVPWIAEVLASRDRSRAGITAPAHGLYLARVRYPDALGIPDLCPTGAMGYDRRAESAGTDVTWFEKIIPSRIKTERRTRSVPEGLWMKCPSCDSVLYRPEIERNLSVCPKCAHHMRVGARDRLTRFLDPDTATEIGADVTPEDPLRFRDSKRYRDRLMAAQKTIGERDALVVMTGMLDGIEIVACAFEFAFMGGSMGSVVGERFVRGVEHSIAQRMPFVCFSASGGARMQEGLLSLLQMAKTSAALAALARHGLPYISVQTDPTTGGVSASLAMLGDVIIAEPRALIGFAGPRVIQQTVRETLPEGFQRSEFLLEHGAIDLIVDRRDLRDRIAGLLRMLLRRPAVAS